MINYLKEYLLEKSDAIEIDKRWININSVIATPTGIYGLAEFDNEDELIQSWEECSYELSTKVQAKITEQLDNLRWDIYLIMLVNSTVSSLNRKVIENDRKFFKKIVIPNNEIDLDRLPFIFEMKNNKRETESKAIIHQDEIFLESLKSILSNKAKEMFGLEFFVIGNKYGSEDIYRLLKHNKGDVR